MAAMLGLAPFSSSSSHMTHSASSSYVPVDLRRSPLSSGRPPFQDNNNFNFSPRHCVDQPSAFHHSRAGLQTPPPEMASFNRPAHLKQFEPPIALPSVPTMYESYRPQSRQVLKTEQRSPPPSRRPSLYDGSLHGETPTAKPTAAKSSATLTVPSSVNGSNENLAEFAAKIACLLWFQSPKTLQVVAETPESQLSPLPVLGFDSIPQTGFRKWVTTILASTQVSSNVILLALLFIYRLKLLNSRVEGKPGSEFRLFTVALMLGNKFLDDNTYTNKTWADVSGIPVSEVHVMEVEFLSNMRYTLFVGEQEWTDWHAKLQNLRQYWGNASQRPLEFNRRGSATAATLFNGPPLQLPSPPPSNNSSPPFGNLTSPPEHHYPRLPAPQPLQPPQVMYTLMPQPDFEIFSRKRSSIDFGNALEPPAKRVARTQGPRMSVTVPEYAMQLPAPAPMASAPLLPRIPPPVSTYGTVAEQFSTIPAHLPHLPLPAPRTMPVLYSQAPPPPLHIPTSAASPHPIDISPFCSRQASPYVGEAVHHSAATSPTTPVYGGQESQESPSWFLSNRNSPYRPVRSCNTLLVPPPPSMHQPQQLPSDQIYYQPLTKSRALPAKPGFVPYMHSEMTWNQTWQQPQFF